MNQQLKRYYQGATLWPRVVVLVIFSSIGYSLLTTTQAATYSVPAEAESGGMAGNGAAYVDTTASAGRALRFGSAAEAGTSGNNTLTPLALSLAPYAYVPWGDIVMADHATATGIKNYYGAFIQAGGASACVAFWDGDLSLGMNSGRAAAIASDISNVRAKGGDVSISFGGAGGTELANACANTAATQSAYQTVISKYNAKHINFDLEGSSLTNHAAMLRRVQAIYNLQQANPDLRVSLTLPVEMDGLTDEAFSAVNKFTSAGVVISQIGIMAMDFDNPLDLPLHGMVINSAQSSLRQMRDLFPGTTDAQLHQALNVIVMLGKNDTADVLDITDAGLIRDYIRTNNIGTLSYWSAARDQQCGSTANATVELDTCSQVKQTKYQFAGIFKAAFSQ